MKDLLIVCPSRGRPENIRELRSAWTSTTRFADLAILVDDDDPTVEDYVAIDVETNNPNPYPWTFRTYVGPRRRVGPTLNVAAAFFGAVYRSIGFLGDDHRPRTVGWDERFWDELRRPGPQIVYGNDLLQGEAMATAVAMTTDITRRLGYMVPPTLTHLNLDVVWVEWGRALGRLTYLDDVVIEHLHPAAGKAKLDAGYIEVNSPEMVEADGAAFAAYKADRFDLDVAKLRELL